MSKKEFDEREPQDYEDWEDFDQENFLDNGFDDNYEPLDFRYEDDELPNPSGLDDRNY